jgi:MerR family transcriptional regulator, copper efflux regulator
LPKKARRRTIGQLARDAGVGVETIRFYERCGLIDRPVRSPNGGHRHYGDDAVTALRYIRSAKRLGFALKDIHRLKQQLAMPTVFCEAMRVTIEHKLLDVEREIAALVAQRNQLDEFLSHCRAKQPWQPCLILSDLGRSDH